MHRGGEPRFYAFDLLWQDGEELHYLPLVDRKLRLRSLIPERGVRLLYCDHIEQDGEGLFRLACEHDLEGVVGKWKLSPYLPDRLTSWLKIRNRSTANGSGGRSCSSGSGAATRIFAVGICV